MSFSLLTYDLFKFCLHPEIIVQLSYMDNVQIFAFNDLFNGTDLKKVGIVPVFKLSTAAVATLVTGQYKNW